jgi:CelD/BcsL family acetyltransferase involved in cellulose biosynthesis
MMFEARRWLLDDFDQAEAVWDELVAGLPFPGLFMSWQWQRQWWRQWGRDHELCLFAAYQGEQVVGILPLFLSRAWLRGVIPVRRLQFIGNYWRGPTTVRSEFLDVMMAKGHPDAEVICDTLAQKVLCDVVFDEWVLQDSLLPSSIGKWAAQQPGGYLRTESEECAPYVGLSLGFEGYLSCLSKNNRRQAYHKRRVLEQLGEITFLSVDSPRYFLALEQLHHIRWQSPLFHRGAEEFHRRICRQFDSSLSSILCLDGEPISAIYCLALGDQGYFLQGGFDGQLDKRLSLGLMHLLYAIESAHGRFETLELLAGGGMQEDYKQKLANGQRTLGCWRWIRNPALVWLFERFDALTSDELDVAGRRV